MGSKNSPVLVADEILKAMQKFLARETAKNLHRPHIIEFTGTPDSGKTTLISGVDSLLRKWDFRVRIPQEGAEVFRHIPRSTPLYNILTGAYGLRNVIEAAYSHDCDFVLLDRALYDAHAWMIYWREKGQLSARQCAKKQSFFMDFRYLQFIDLCFYVTCSAEEAMRRANLDAPSRHQPPKDGNFTNQKTIEKLIGYFQESAAVLGTLTRPIASVDTTILTKPEMFDLVTDRILESVNRRIRAGIEDTGKTEHLY